MLFYSGVAATSCSLTVHAASSSAPPYTTFAGDWRGATYITPNEAALQAALRRSEALPRCLRHSTDRCCSTVGTQAGAQRREARSGRAGAGRAGERHTRAPGPALRLAFNWLHSRRTAGANSDARLGRMWKGARQHGYTASDCYWLAAWTAGGPVGFIHRHCGASAGGPDRGWTGGGDLGGLPEACCSRFAMLTGAA